jgi:hypothetical protein
VRTLLPGGAPFSAEEPVRECRCEGKEAGITDPAGPDGYVLVLAEDFTGGVLNAGYLREVCRRPASRVRRMSCHRPQVDGSAGVLPRSTHTARANPYRQPIRTRGRDAAQTRARAISRSSRAATLLYEPARTTTRQPSCFEAMSCYARVRGGRRGGDPWMACKGSGVQIPSAPPGTTQLRHQL